MSLIFCFMVGKEIMLITVSHVEEHTIALVYFVIFCFLSYEFWENHTAKDSCCGETAQGFLRPTLKSHTSDVGFRSQTLQLDPTISPCSAQPRHTHGLVVC